MSEGYTFLSRPPKLAPLVSLVIGIVWIPLGLIIKGTIGGGLVGGGIGFLLMAGWDFSRLRFVAWRRAHPLRKSAEENGPS